jgi:hypothetical protein
MPKENRPYRAAVKLNEPEHKLMHRLADIEGRTLQGVVTLALRAYAKKKAPQALVEVYGDRVVA